ncbi:hypothetical protein Btru_031662 [Bulinus truncatus]|nr:hypothetical protein Btru_031662 [Bulinus truncatus]
MNLVFPEEILTCERWLSLRSEKADGRCSEHFIEVTYNAPFYKDWDLSYLDLNLYNLEEKNERLETPSKEVSESLLISTTNPPQDNNEILQQPTPLSGPMKPKLQVFKSREALMSRANSLKKAVRQIIEHTERAVDEQNAQTLEMENCNFRNSAMFKASEASRSAPSFSVFLEEDPQLTTINHETLPQVPDPSRSPLGPASRRISSMSTFNRSASVDSKLGASPGSKGKEEHLQLPAIKLPFIQPTALPGISSSIAKNLTSGGFISKVLLANADALCAAASPLIEQDIPLESYHEKCVMNNYFGIGLDAKITLEFQNKREEHPEKCRSRTKNMMWYGVLGGKEMINQTFKNLDQRVLLECDGQRIPLPSLQGIVILNIPSYGGGANFWGGSKQDENFTAPSFDDRILEVVAVFGSMQMAMSRVIDLQHHRIAQCRTVKVTILGDEGVPVQVDGEAWIQPPGYVRIVHKNRAQMLIRDRTFENVLKSWSEKQKTDRPVSPQPLSLTEDETQVLLNFVEATSAVIRSVKVAAKSHSCVENDLIPIAQQTSEYVDRLYPTGKLAEPTLRSQLVDLVQTVRILYHETSIFLLEKSASSTNPHRYYLYGYVSEFSLITSSDVSKSGGPPYLISDHLGARTKRIIDIIGLVKLEPLEQNLLEHMKRKQGRLKQVYSKFKGRSKEKLKVTFHLLLTGDITQEDTVVSCEIPGPPPLYYLHSEPTGSFEIRSWTLEEVGQWLESLSLGEYKDSFMSHEITGAELLNLERRDLKASGGGSCKIYLHDLGITKVGHLKRIQQVFFCHYFSIFFFSHFFFFVESWPHQQQLFYRCDQNQRRLYLWLHLLLLYLTAPPPPPSQYQAATAGRLFDSFSNMFFFFIFLIHVLQYQNFFFFVLISMYGQCVSGRLVSFDELIRKFCFFLSVVPAPSTVQQLFFVLVFYLYYIYNDALDSRI